MLHEAIRALYDTAVLIQGNTVNDVVVKDKNGDEVSIVKDDVTAKITELEDATAYIHARSNAYPSIKDQLDWIWHAIEDGNFTNAKMKDTDFYKKLKEVKDDNPK
tara:strand:- start:389 stop:703 length:315 start_codon:yes stop_codon:yes gene_type:complete